VSELVHFRNRIGEEGIKRILKEIIAINNDDNNENHSPSFIDLPIFPV